MPNLRGLLSRLAQTKPLTYIQVGANDGVLADPLWPFLKSHGDGIAAGHLFEPSPIYFERLCRAMAPYPQIRCHNAAIGTAGDAGTRTLYYIHPDDVAAHGLPPWTMGIGSFYLDRNALGGIGPQQTPEIHATIRPHIREAPVRTLTLAEALARTGLPRCDALITDTEGHDWDILQQWDADRYGRPAVIHSEIVCLREPDKAALLAWLTARGYLYELQGQDVTAWRPDVLPQ